MWKNDIVSTTMEVVPLYPWCSGNGKKLMAHFFKLRAIQVIGQD